MDSRPVRATIQFAVAQDRLGDVETIQSNLAQSAIASTASTCEVFLHKDRRQLHLLLTFAAANADALIFAMGPDLERLEKCARLTRLDIYGNVAESLQEALAPFNPQCFASWASDDH